MNNFPKRLNIDWLKQNYQQQKLSPRDVMIEILKRTADYKDYNIWITPPSTEYIEPYLKKLENTMPQELPLWGIPFAVKDNIDVIGMPTTAACAAYAYMPKKNAFVVEQLIAAGAVPIGKTNLDQFATGLVGTRSFYGEVHNSLRQELISGGSSSGSSVAVSLGLCAFALGTDTAGSGRVPAALNCLVGYKPSLGAWSKQGVVPACASLDTITAFAGNIKDINTVNDAARGFDEECCWARQFTAPEKHLPKKIYLPAGELEFFGDFAAEYKQKWQKAVQRLQEMCIPVEFINIDIFNKAASLLYDGPWIAERWQDLGKFVEEHPEDIFPVTEKILRSGDVPEYTAAKTFEAIHELQRYKAKAYKILQDAVLILPTAGGTFTRKEVQADPIGTNSKMGLYTNHCNLLDLCAIAVPENTQDMDLPFGITMFARAENEGLILELADDFIKNQTMELAVCGLHMQNMPFEPQLTSLGAKYIETNYTAPEYKLVQLDTKPIKPGLVYTGKGTSIEIDIYQLSKQAWGDFLTQVKGPLCIGNIKLIDGRIVNGFLCEDYFAKQAKDISSFGSFRKFAKQNKLYENTYGN